MSDTYYREALSRLSRVYPLRRPQILSSSQGTRVQVGERVLRNFASEDYLGLASDARVVEAVREAVQRWGWGAGASRFHTGMMQPHVELEEALARFARREAAIVYPSRYMSMHAALRNAAGEGDAVFVPHDAPAAIMDAARCSGAWMQTYPRHDLGQLAERLRSAEAAQRRVILTQTVLPLEGQVADLRPLAELKRQFQATLCVDESQAIGIYGDHGRGVAEAQGVESDIDVVVSGFSKAFGCNGGFIAGSRAFIDHLLQTVGLEFDLIPAPAACVAVLTAMEIVAREPQRRAHLHALGRRTRERLSERLGGAVGGDSINIVPVSVGEVERLLRIGERLHEAGYIVPLIHPPLVGPQQARLLVRVTAAHDDEAVDGLVGCLVECLKAAA